MNTQLVQDDLQIQLAPIDMICMIFGAHVNTLFIINMNVLMLIKWPCMSPSPIMLIV